MTPTRLTSLGLAVLLAAIGCGKARESDGGLGSVTLPGGAADGSDVTVDVKTCVQCHGDLANATDPATDAAGIELAPPVDVTRATTGAKVGAHMKHLRAGALHGEGYHCSTCHVIPQNAGEHTPGVLLRGLALGTGTAQFTPGAAGAAGSCSSTYCHGAFLGGNAVAMAWNATGPLGCNGCHGRGTGGAATPPVTTHAAGDTICGSCHPGYTQIDVNLATHVDGNIDGGCTACHGTPARGNGGIVGAAYDPLQNAAPPLDASGASTGLFVGAHIAHVNPVPSAAGGTQPTGGIYKPIACTECHPDNRVVPHDGTPTVTFSAATAANLASFVPSFSKTAGSPVTCNTYCHDAKGGGSVATWSWTGAAATCASCHAFPPASHTGVAANAAACNGCHGETVKADGTIDIAGGKHIDGTVQGGGESAGGAACSGCHGAIVAGMTGASTSRHALTSSDPAFQTGVSWVAPLSGTAVANRSCTNMCHDDHPHEAAGPTDHSYNLYTDANQRANTATTTTRARTDFDAAAANGGPCISCHRFASAATSAIDMAAYDASAHDYSTSTWTWEYVLHSGTFARNCTKCHASATEGTTPSASASGSGTAAVHFNTNPTLLAGTKSPIAAGNVCFNCHGSAGSPANGAQGNRSGKNIQAQFAKANPHDSAGSCLDCHAPHAARGGTHATPGNKAGPPIQGAAGAALTTNPAFWTAPAAGAFNATAIVAGTDVEATLCFKCHSAFAGTLPAGTTDTAREFNPNNTGNWATAGTANQWNNGETAGGFHPVLASAGNNLGAVNLANLLAPWNAARSLMTCTDCHESNSTTDPNGPHGSTAAFILKGPNVAWNAASAATSTGMPGGVFCRNCHSATWASSRFTGTQHYSRSAHRVPCMNCHAAIPHGGPRPGMLVAPAGKSTNVPTHVGWDDAASVYRAPGAGSTLYIVSYPQNSATAWGQSNCGCNGTGH